MGTVTHEIALKLSKREGNPLHPFSIRPVADAAVMD
jgi:hypothetical protein